MSETNSKVSNGWTAGFGLENFINDKISVRAEYRYSSYSSEDFNIVMWSAVEHQKYDDEQSFRIGLNYHF